MHKPVNSDGEILVRPFADWLREQSKGASHDELSDALHSLVESVLDTGRKGTLQYTIMVDPKGAGGALVVTDQIKLRPPERDRDGSIFWADDDGNLRRQDPKQLSFDSLREVPMAETHETPTEKGSTA